MKQPNKIVFFGGEPLGVPTLEVLLEVGIKPDLIVCSPDRPTGRGLKMTAPAVKIWGEKHSVPTLQPTSYKNPEDVIELSQSDWDLFIVVAYNSILPSWLITLPRHGTINVHPSLLPKLRGPSPIRTAILDNTPEYVGVSIMLMDEKMDHGPLLAQEKFDITKLWPLTGPALDSLLAKAGATLLTETIPQWLSGDILPVEQEHESATYTKKFQKPNNQIDINPYKLPTGDEAVNTLHKIYAWAGIGDAFFVYNDTRVKVKSATLTDNGQLLIERVVPAGKSEMEFDSYLAGTNGG